MQMGMLFWNGAGRARIFTGWDEAGHGEDWKYSETPGIVLGKG